MGQKTNPINARPTVFPQIFSQEFVTAFSVRKQIFDYLKRKGIYVGNLSTIIKDGTLLIQADILISKRSAVYQRKIRRQLRSLRFFYLLKKKKNKKKIYSQKQGTNFFIKGKNTIKFSKNKFENLKEYKEKQLGQKKSSNFTPNREINNKNYDKKHSYHKFSNKISNINNATKGKKI
jgi:hypothetical protein